MPTHKINYKLNAVHHYLLEDKTQVNVCKILKCSPRSLCLFVLIYDFMQKYNILYEKKTDINDSCVICVLFHMFYNKSYENN